MGANQKIMTIDDNRLVSYEEADNMTPKYTSYNVLATSVSRDLEADVYVVGYTNSEFKTGKITLMMNGAEQAHYFGEQGSLSSLGEHVWIGFDGELVFGGKPLILATSYASETSRWINVFKVVFDDLYLWSKQVLEIPTSSLETLTFVNGQIMWLHSGQLHRFTICNHNSAFSHSECVPCPDNSGTFALHQSECTSCD